jgi:hypothetical protein
MIAQGKVWRTDIIFRFVGSYIKLEYSYNNDRTTTT